jgi:transposase
LHELVPGVGARLNDGFVAVPDTVDWKYALGLSLIDPGFDHTVLSEFRSRLVEGGAERLLLDTLLQRLRDHGLVKAKGRQRTDSTHVLAAVRGLNRLERVGETVRAALNELAVVAPDWLQALAPPVSVSCEAEAICALGSQIAS